MKTRYVFRRKGLFGKPLDHPPFFHLSDAHVWRYRQGISLDSVRVSQV